MRSSLNVVRTQTRLVSATSMKTWQYGKATCILALSATCDLVRKLLMDLSSRMELWCDVDAFDVLSGNGPTIG